MSGERENTENPLTLFPLTFCYPKLIPPFPYPGSRRSGFARL
jgi:hypothetical protein